MKRIRSTGSLAHCEPRMAEIVAEMNECAEATSGCDNCPIMGRCKSWWERQNSCYDVSEYQLKILKAEFSQIRFEKLCALRRAGENVTA